MKNPTKNTSTKATSLKKRLASRFLKAIKNLNMSSSMADGDRRRRAVRAAAYASMAAAVGPRKVWSRALLRKLRNQTKERRTHHPDVRKRAVMLRGNPRNPIGEELNDLSGLVPGGDAMDSCRLLNETGHYIECLRAQVQIMRQILDFSSSGVPT